jgi:hypothetical protein
MSAMAEHRVFDFIWRDVVASTICAGRLKFASWERRGAFAEAPSQALLEQKKVSC